MNLSPTVKDTEESVNESFLDQQLNDLVVVIPFSPGNDLSTAHSSSVPQPQEQQ